MYINTLNALSADTVDNNTIYKISGDGNSDFTGSPVGIYVDGATTGGINIYYNSVYLSGDMTNASATVSSAILFYNSGISGIDLKNNI